MITQKEEIVEEKETFSEFSAQVFFEKPSQKKWLKAENEEEKEEKDFEIEKVEEVKEPKGFKGCIFEVCFKQ